MIVVAFILSIISSLIIGFVAGNVCMYKVFQDEAKKFAEK